MNPSPSADEQALLDSFFGPSDLSEHEKISLKQQLDEQWEAQFQQDSALLDELHEVLQTEWDEATPTS